MVGCQLEETLPVGDGACEVAPLCTRNAALDPGLCVVRIVLQGVGVVGDGCLLHTQCCMRVTTERPGLRVVRGDLQRMV